MSTALPLTLSRPGSPIFSEEEILSEAGEEFDEQQIVSGETTRQITYIFLGDNRKRFEFILEIRESAHPGLNEIIVNASGSPNPPLISLTINGINNIFLSDSNNHTIELGFIILCGDIVQRNFQLSFQRPRVEIPIRIIQVTSTLGNSTTQNRRV